MINDFDNIDDYIEQFPLDIQIKLETLRKLTHIIIPNCEETIKYGIPTFVLNKTNMIHFAGYKSHIGFYPTPLVIENFLSELKTYKVSKGAVQFPLKNELPINLIQKMIEYRLTLK